MLVEKTYVLAAETRIIRMDNMDKRKSGGENIMTALAREKKRLR